MVLLVSLVFKYTSGEDFSELSEVFAFFLKTKTPGMLMFPGNTRKPEL